MTTTTKASDRQVSYLNSLIDTACELDPEMASLRDSLDVDHLDRRAASAAIDRMRETNSHLRALARQAALPKLSPGFYQVDGEVFEVKRSATGNLYAKAIDPETGQFEYAKGAIFRLDGATPMTLREAAEFGKVHGRCVVCGRTLSNITSIEAGIGPICSRRFA